MKKWTMRRLNLAAIFWQRLPSLGLLCASLALWEFACWSVNIPEYILPSPTTIMEALTGNFPLLVTHTAGTLYAVTAGLTLATLIAVMLALLINRRPSIKKILYPPLVISQAVPIFAVAPIILIWLGVGLKPKIAVVALVCFFPLAVSLVEGLEQVDPDALDLMRVMQAGSGFVFRSVQLPSVMPYFFSGLKISATYSVMGAIIGEWLGGSIGLGVYMTRSMYSFKTSHMFAAILIVIALSLALFKLTELLAGLAMPWESENYKQE